MLVYVSRSKKFLNLTPKIAMKEPKVEKGHKFGRIKNKKIGLYFQKTKLFVNMGRFQRCFNLTPTPKIAPKGKKVPKGQHDSLLPLM